jgi:hypothetical protein
MKVIVHYPDDALAREYLSRNLADIYALEVAQQLRGTNCTKEMRCEIIERLTNCAKDASSCQHSRSL